MLGVTTVKLTGGTWRSSRAVLLDFKSQHGIADTIDAQQTTAFVEFAAARLAANGLDEDYLSHAELE